MDDSTDPTDSRKKKLLYVSIFVVTAVVFAIYMSVGSGSGGSPRVAIPKRYYTVDDGRTYYPDTIDKLPPYKTPENKTALRVQVMQCAGEAPFVAYVEKYPDAEKARLERLFQDAKTTGLAVSAVMGPEDHPLVKKPGSKGAWTDASNGSRYEAITQPACAKGGTPQVVLPKQGE
jgi:hypothetical protein